jgi:hypothetical protein
MHSLDCLLQEFAHCVLAGDVATARRMLRLAHKLKLNINFRNMVSISHIASVLSPITYRDIWLLAEHAITNKNKRKNHSSTTITHSPHFTLTNTADRQPQWALTYCYLSNSTTSQNEKTTPCHLWGSNLPPSACWRTSLTARPSPILILHGFCVAGRTMCASTVLRHATEQPSHGANAAGIRSQDRLDHEGR